MALLVSTKPPELIIRTKRKKIPMRRDDAPFLCDRFWECVLSDYVEDFDSEDDIVARSTIRRNVASNERISRKKNTEKKKKKHGEVLVEISKPDDIKEDSKVHSETLLDHQASSDQRPDPASQVGVEPETLLSNDPEQDQRENAIDEPPRSNEVVEIEPTPPTEVIVKQSVPDHAKNRYRKLDGRIPSAPTELRLPSKLGKGFSHTKEYEPEEETDQPTETRKKGSGRVIHYAPLYTGQHGTSSTRRSRTHIPPLVSESRSTRNSRRVAVDPDEHRPLSGRIPRTRDMYDPDHTQSSAMNFLPRAPSNARGDHPLHSRSTDPRSNLPVHPKHDGSRVETIDLTKGHFLQPSPVTREGRAEDDRQDDNGKFKTCEDTVNWMLLESKKAESDYRRRKLDRKEALDRIRAIKARLQTVDP